MKNAVINEIMLRRQYVSRAKANACLQKVVPDPRRDQLIRQCYQHIHMIDSWMALLSAKEVLIMKRRLIDGASWKRVETEYEEYCGAGNGRTERTLRKYLNESVLRIVAFIEVNDDVRAILFDSTRCCVMN